jgi:hypothetical protein
MSGVLGLASKAKVKVSGKALRELERHGVEYRVVDGELFIDGRDWRRYNRLCDEGKLHREVC